MLPVVSCSLSDIVASFSSASATEVSSSRACSLAPPQACRSCSDVYDATEPTFGLSIMCDKALAAWHEGQSIWEGVEGV